jgi:hypothetical protein
MADRPSTAREKLSARQRQERLAAELRSNLRKRKQQAQRRARREDTAAAAPGGDKKSAPNGPGEPEGGPPEACQKLNKG